MLRAITWLIFAATLGATILPWPPPTTSFTSVLSVTFNHNLNRLRVQVFCYSATDLYVQPKQVTYVTVNQALIEFDVASTGVCTAR